MTEAEITDNGAANRYELAIGGQRIGVADYRDAGAVREIHHTGVDPNWTGRGLATQLVAFALRDIRARGMLVRPTCSMVAAYIDKHPEDAELLG